VSPNLFTFSFREAATVIRTIWKSLAIVLTLVISIIAFTALVNPYQYLDAKGFENINTMKFKNFSSLFTTQPYRFERHPARNLIIGNSRAGSMFASSHPAWGEGDAFNYFIPGGDTKTLFYALKHASANREIQKLVISLDFTMFNEHKGSNRMESDAATFIRQTGPPHQKWLRRLRDKLGLFLSWQAISDSIFVLKHQSEVDHNRDNISYISDSGEWFQVQGRKRIVHRQFMTVAKTHMTIIWHPKNSPRFTLSVDPGEYDSPMYYFEAILDAVYRNNINAQIVINPVHAYITEAMHTIGLWEDFERWKRALVRVTENAAQRANRPALPLWDFASYNRINTELIAPKTSYKKKPPRYYMDGSHPNQKAGNYVLRALWLGRDPLEAGEKMTAENIEQHLLNIRARRERYKRSNPVVIEELEKIAKKTRHLREP